MVGSTIQFDGPQRGLLREALLNAFDEFTFPQVLTERLNKSLGRYASPNLPLNQILFHVINGANQEGWVGQLVAKMREANPGNPVLAAFAEQVGMAAAEKTKLELLISPGNPAFDVHVFLAKLSRLEYQVCRIEVPTEQNSMMYGTGFLIGQRLVLTNYHVMEAVILGEQGKTTVRGKSAKATEVRCRFDYKVMEGQTVNAGTVWKLADQWKVDASPYDPASPKNLDFAVLRLEGSPGTEPIGAAAGATGEKRGFVSLPAAAYPFPADSPLFILQHPNAQPLKLAMEMKSVGALTPDGSRVSHRTNTEEGSSGSPCFTQELIAVALHQSGDPAYPPKPSMNGAIPLHAIRALMQERGTGGELG